MHVEAITVPVQVLNEQTANWPKGSAQNTSQAPHAQGASSWADYFGVIRPSQALQSSSTVAFVHSRVNTPEFGAVSLQLF